MATPLAGVGFGSSKNARLVKSGFSLVAKAKRMVPELAEGMREEMLATIAEAKTITPKDTGDLRASGFVRQPKIRTFRVDIQAGFGGGIGAVSGRPIDYAIPVHEDLTVFHPIGQAKFLETAFLARIPSIQRNLAHLIRRNLRSAF